MPAPQLTVHNAEIKTATVEIKTLTVSGKQVTLAVFRQLREAPLIAEDGTLNGTPWGIVNYHPDKCADLPIRHMHVVWQRGSELLRSSVGTNPRWISFRSKKANAYVAAAYCANDHSYPAWLKRSYAVSGSEADVLFDLDDVRCVADIPPRCQAKAYVRPDGTSADAPPCQASADLAAFRDLLAGEVGEEMARRRRHLKEIKALVELPQLFIAV